MFLPKYLATNGVFEIPYEFCEIYNPGDKTLRLKATIRITIWDASNSIKPILQKVFKDINPKKNFCLENLGLW